MYYQGRGVEQSYSEALKYYQQSAEQGNSNAQNNLGVMYEKVLELNKAIQALKYYQQSAEQGNSNAQITWE